MQKNGGYSGGGFYPPKKSDTVQRRKRKHSWFLPLICVVVLAVGGVFLSKKLDSDHKAERYQPYENVFLPDIRIDDISLSGMTYEQGSQAVMNSVNARQNSWYLSLTYQGHTFITMNYETMGMNTDLNQVRQMLDSAYHVGHVGDIDQRLNELDTRQQNPINWYTTQSAMTDVNVDTILNQIANFYYRDPVDAYLVSFNPDASDPFTIQAEQYGTYLDTNTLKQEILRRAATGESGTLELSLSQIEPAVKTADIRKNVTLLSTGVTAISTSSEEGRTNNIRQAFSKINGLQLADGKNFSFNTVVGKRTTKNGFYEAPEYAYNELVRGIGGGVCQASTTVYLAALCANLKITKRTVHSSVVNYTEMGQDATVSDRGIDLCFQNTSGGVIYMTAHVEKVPNTKNRLQCVVKIYGPSMGDNVYYKLRSVKVEELEPDLPTYEKDNKGEYVTYEDETYKYRSASKGYIVETYLQRWENKKMVEEHVITRDTYKAKNEIWYVGVKRRE